MNYEEIAKRWKDNFDILHHDPIIDGLSDFDADRAARLTIDLIDDLVSAAVSPTQDTSYMDKMHTLAGIFVTSAIKYVAQVDPTGLPNNCREDEGA